MVMVSVRWRDVSVTMAFINGTVAVSNVLIVFDNTVTTLKAFHLNIQFTFNSSPLHTMSDLFNQ